MVPGPDRPRVARAIGGPVGRTGGGRAAAPIRKAGTAGDEIRRADCGGIADLIA
jgi:hypothetical protein